MTDDRIEQTLQEVLADGVFLAVRLDDGAKAAEACRAAIRGGLRVIEMTLTTPGALEVIRALAAEGAGVIGAGTVLTVEDARRVAECGARFAMSPVTDEEVI
ncbi:MAG TPA: keto-deoxy-phosphogluconate aldolase, partial [bacterium]|nr:keto-deoxy-phosphogluconate aldolase [bacterium]